MDELVEDKCDGCENKLDEAGILHLQPNDIFETSGNVSGLLDVSGSLVETQDEPAKDIKDLIINIDTTKTPSHRSSSCGALKKNEEVEDKQQTDNQYQISFVSSSLGDNSHRRFDKSVKKNDELPVIQENEKTKVEEKSQVDNSHRHQSALYKKLHKS